MRHRNKAEIRHRNQSEMWHRNKAEMWHRNKAEMWHRNKAEIGCAVPVADSTYRGSGSKQHERRLPIIYSGIVCIMPLGEFLCPKSSNDEIIVIGGL